MEILYTEKQQAECIEVIDAYLIEINMVLEEFEGKEIPAELKESYLKLERIAETLKTVIEEEEKELERLGC